MDIVAMIIASLSLRYYQVCILKSSPLQGEVGGVSAKNNQNLPYPLLAKEGIV